MRRLLIFLVLAVLLEYVLTWALAHYGLVVLGAMQLVDVEPVAGAPSCVALPPRPSVAPGGVFSSGGGASRLRSASRRSLFSPSRRSWAISALSSFPGPLYWSSDCDPTSASTWRTRCESAVHERWLHGAFWHCAIVGRNGDVPRVERSAPLPVGRRYLVSLPPGLHAEALDGPLCRAGGRSWGPRGSGDARSQKRPLRRIGGHLGRSLPGARRLATPATSRDFTLGAALPRTRPGRSSGEDRAA